MTRKVISLSMLLSASLFAGSLSVSNGWNLSGAIGDINSSSFSGSNNCVKALWTYSSSDTSQSWSLYHRDVTAHSYTQLTTIPQATGFWALVDGTNCFIDYESDNDTVTSSSGTIVDPYIAGAVLFQDDNNNSMWDSGEIFSSMSDSNGSFMFDSALTPGKNIRIKTQGIHEGEVYDLNISAVVNSQGAVDVVSPLTNT